MYPSKLILNDKWTLAMRWTDSADLVVTIPKTARIYKKDGHAGKITISYK